MKKLPKLSEKLKKDKKLLLTVAAGILGIVFIVISEFIPKSSYKKAETGEQIRIPYRHMRKRLKNVSKALFPRLTERAGYRLW